MHLNFQMIDIEILLNKNGLNESSECSGNYILCKILRRLRFECTTFSLDIMINLKDFLISKWPKTP